MSRIGLKRKPQSAEIILVKNFVPPKALIHEGWIYEISLSPMAVTLKERSKKNLVYKNAARH